MVLEMRRRGIRIDQDAAEQARDSDAKREAALAELSARSVAVSMDEINRSENGRPQIFDAHGIGYPCAGKVIRRSRPANPVGW